MKIALFLALFFSASLAHAGSVDRLLLANQTAIQNVCGDQLARQGGGFLPAARALYQMSHRQTRDAYLDYDGTDCDLFLKNLQPRGSAANCSEVVQAVTGALASCWNNVNRGCTTAVAQQYAYLMAQASRADASCSSRIEIACRQECYPRFPTDCNRSCATLASYTR